MFASHETFGILDTGATKSVIGSDLLPDLIKGLKPKIRQKLFRCQCSVTFRFGNQGTLESKTALVIPVGNLGLKISIVQGSTPLLLSNTLLRTLQAQVDVAKQLLHSPMLIKPLSLQLTPRGLSHLDINDLAEAASPKCKLAETLASVGTTGPSEKMANSAVSSSEESVPRLEKHEHVMNDRDQQPRASIFQPSECEETFISSNIHLSFHDKHSKSDTNNQPVQRELQMNTQSFDDRQSNQHHEASRFKAGSQEPIALAVESRAAPDYESLQAPERPQDGILWGPSGRIQGHALRNDVQSPGRLRQGPLGQTVSECVASGTVLGALGRENL